MLWISTFAIARHALENLARLILHDAHSPHAGVDLEID
jgi:hypothetical protein